MPRLIFFTLLSIALTAFAADTAPDAQPASMPLPAASPTAAPSKISYSSAHVDGPCIALTFDDGPSAANTPRLLDLLAKRHIKATFFMVGECAAQNPDIVKRIAAEGHEIGNHSWSHPNFALMSDEKVRNELQSTDDAIFKASGIHPKLMRPPYGSLSSLRGQAKWITKTFGYKIILWDVDPLDWKIRNAAHVESEILKQTRSGSIVLSHDIHATTVDAMPATIDALIAKGFKFFTVSELIAMDRPQPPKTAASPAEKSAEPKPYAPPAATPAPSAAAN
jgi:peptidoglycan/xylan/chitin deacetylase (PgdA/CDA1 family)